RLFFDDAVVVERIGLELFHDWRPNLRAACDKQSGLGQPVAREEGFAPEAARPKSLGEQLQRLRTDGLGAVEGDTPTAQVESGARLGSGLPRAHLVGEVRAAARCGAVVRDGLEPAQWLLQERDWRHQHATRASV